ncbi:MAG: hypothetical protein HKM87_05530 [Ignavibacteriaceae bacterium]|nr:hypothetical protein [Ignavibacteriaceae bacterium]
MKKIYIIGLILSFLFSTTGYTITMHYCKMMEETSSSECGICADTEVPEEMPCCEEDNFSSDIITSGTFSDCCEIQVVDNKLKDEFSISGNTKIITCIVVVSIKPSILQSEKEGKNFQQNKFNLPPPKFGKQLLQAIHQLKIDLPIC